MSDKQLESMNNRPLATTGGDPFLAYGARAGVSGAQFLTFKAGEWLYGQNSAVLPLGTKLAANMQGLRIGWRRWWGGQVEDRTVPLTENLPVEPRSSLGDLDESQWELSPEGKRRDPWVWSNILELVDPETGTSYLYTTSSKGGQGAIGKLCETFGRLYRQRPGQTALVALGNDFYVHPQYGKTYVPALLICGWMDDTGKLIEDDEPAASGAAATKPAAVAPPANKTDRKTPRF